MRDLIPLRIKARAIDEGLLNLELRLSPEDNLLFIQLTGLLQVGYFRCIWGTGKLKNPLPSNLSRTSAAFSNESSCL
ncbi:hypothetical protein TNCV_2612961 [Trichonephila clavipes]|nr:hypothetical protein TNCV_2612961 [Trichonephila clavipes]